MTAKLCPHFQTVPKWASKINYPGAWVKVCDPGAGISSRFPGKRIIARYFLEGEGDFIRRGADGGTAYYDRLAAHYEECAGDVLCFEGINEPVVHTIEEAQTLCAFLMRWMGHMHAHGFTVAVPAFSVGNPESWVIAVLAPVWEAAGYVTLHTYGTRRIDEEWRAYTSLRYRMVAAQIEALGIPTPDMLLTEAGIDRGGDGYRKKPGNTPWPEYRSQLFWYEDRLQEDDYVQAAFIFTSGATKTWASFAVEEGEWNDLAKGLGR